MQSEPASATEEERDVERRVQARLHDPEVQVRIRTIHQRMGQTPSGPGISAEQLPDFLSEQKRKAMDARSRDAG